MSTTPPATADDEVVVGRRGRVSVITLNRPDQRNAINGGLATQLRDAIRDLDTDDSLTAGIIHGAGRSFCSGMDLKAFAKGEDIAPFFEFIQEGSRKPLLAAIEGFAFGGGLELALACDLLVLAEDARVGLPETKVGLFAAGGGLLRLPARVGISKALEMALTGDPLDASDALRLGLASRISPPGAALSGALALAESIAGNAPLAVAASKQLIRSAGDLSEADYWTHQKHFYKRVFRSNDAREGSRAFADRRAPQWTGT